MSTSQLPPAKPWPTSAPASFSVPYTPAESIVARAADFFELIKPRIAVMVLLTVSAGYILGSAGNWSPIGLTATLVGIALIASCSSVLNQWSEASIDRAMPRTSRRPIPTGRISPPEALRFGLLLGLLGTLCLAAFVNLLTALLGLATIFMYAAVYTPLKQKTSLCTAIGAIPGAMPPLLGWTAATGQLSWPGFSLFAVLFLWQFPHFLAIAWIYREQYQQAGLKMLPLRNRQSLIVGVIAVVYAIALIPVSLLPREFGLAGPLYSLGCLVLGLLYLVAALGFLRSASIQSARSLLYSSLIYLPCWMTLLILDFYRLTI